MRRCITLTSFIATLTLCACTTVGPDYRIPEHAKINAPAAKKAFIGAANEAYRSNRLPDQWWRLYEAPALDALIEKAFSANTDLRIAAANLARTRAVLDEVETAKIPDIKANAAPTFGRSSANANGYSKRLPDKWKFDGGVSASYQYDLFGKIARGIEAAHADTEASQAAYDLVRVTVAAETARAYLEVCSTGQQIEVAKRSINVQKLFVETTQQLANAGKGTALDVSRASSQFEQARAALPPLKAKRRTALYRLAALTGETPGNLPKEIGQCAVIPKIVSVIPIGDGAALLRRRPDIRQAERELKASNARIGVATADLYPNIVIGLNAGSSGLLSHTGKIDAFNWGIGPLISWSFPATSTARSRIAQAHASHEAALARFDATVLNALRDTESALERYARELDRKGILKAAQSQSALAYEQANKLYRYGRTDFLTALDANRTLTRTESALAASNAQLANQQINLFLAFGGGWKQKPPSKAKNSDVKTLQSGS